MTELFDFEPNLVENLVQHNDSESFKWLKAIQRKHFVANLQMLNEKVVQIVLSDNGISYFCQLYFDVAPLFSLLDNVSTVCSLRFLYGTFERKNITTTTLLFPRQTRLSVCFPRTRRSVSYLFTNFERDIPLSKTHCAIRKNSVVGYETAKALFDAGVDVCCDAFICPQAEQKSLFPELDLPRQTLEVHFTRDNLVNCGWAFLPDLAFDQKSLMRRLNQLFLLLSPLALPVYIVEMIFNHLMTLNLFSRLSTEYNIDGFGFEWAPSESLFAIVFAEVEKRFHYQKIDALTRMMNCAKKMKP